MQLPCSMILLAFLAAIVFGLALLFVFVFTPDAGHSMGMAAFIVNSIFKAI